MKLSELIAFLSSLVGVFVLTFSSIWQVSTCDHVKEAKKTICGIYVMKWVWNPARRCKCYTKMQWQVWRASPPELHALSVQLCSVFRSLRGFSVHFDTPNMHLSHLSLLQSCFMCLTAHTDVFFMCLWRQSSDFSAWVVACADSLTEALSSAGPLLSQREPADPDLRSHTGLPGRMYKHKLHTFG